VRRWASLGAADLEREARFRAGEPGEADFSVTATIGALKRARELQRAHREEEAARAFREAATRAGAIGWQRVRIEAVHGVGRSHFSRGDFRQALVAWEEELSLARELGLDAEAARLLAFLGSTHANLRNMDRARELLEQALRELEAAGDRATAATVLENLGQLLQRTGHPEAARSRLEQALREQEALGSRAGAARVRGLLGRLSQEDGRLDEALDLLRKAYDELTATGDRRSAAQTLATLASLYRQLGRIRDADESFERAAREYEKLGDLGGVARVLHGQAASAEPVARKLELLTRARRSFEELGNHGEVAEVTFSIADVYSHLGLYQESLDLLQGLLKDQERRGDRRVAARTMGMLGIVHDRLGDSPRAIELLQQALAAVQQSRDRQRAMRTLFHLGDASWHARRLDRACDFYRRAAEEAESLGNRSMVLLARAQLGNALVQDGRFQEGIELLESVRPGTESRLASEARVTCLVGLARARLKSGSPDLVFEPARQALRIFRDDERGLAEDETPTFAREARHLSDLGVLAAHQRASGAPTGKDQGLDEAFWFLESGRGLAIARAILNREALMDARLPGDLRSAHAAARSRVARGLQALSRPAAPAAAREELDAGYRDLEAASRRIQREAQSVSQVLYPEPVGLATLQATLPDGAAIVLYQLAEERALALVASRSNVALVELGAAEERIAAVESYLRALSARGSEEGEAVEPDRARKLYDDWLRPLEPLLAGATRLLISPDGPLSFLPFEALLRVDGSRRERALERWEMAYVPSGTAFEALAREAQGGRSGVGLLALGDPVYPAEAAASPIARRDGALRGFGPLERLPGTAAETREIAALFPEGRGRLLLREDATAPKLAEALAGAGGRLAAVHFACHGFVDPERPRLTGLVLAGGGVLGLDDLYRLRIPADLAVLSACETGTGKLVTGDGVSGLVRGFFFAGVPRVVVSNWKVSDAGTRPMMVAFYREMLERGRKPAAALREAKLAMLRAGGAGARPSAWAAFVLWGLPD
jgi:CHAT domain-containing protein/Tfp pilus assembly protein PilF